MTTVSRTSQVTHSSATGGGDWDHRLNRLLEDLQGTVAPEDSKSSGTEYREYRMTSSTRTNDEPPQKVDEKWVEYGSRGGHVPQHGYHSHLRDHGQPQSSSSASSSRTFQKEISSSTSNGVKTYGIDPGLKTSDRGHSGTTQIEYLTPVNTTTVMKSGTPLSPAGPPMSICPATSHSLLPTSSPKVERKEFFAKASYTTLIKGGGANGVPITSDVHDRTVDRFEDISSEPYYPPPAPILSTSKSSSETRREYSRTTERHQSPARELPLYPITPSQHMSSYSSTQRIEDRSATPPPPDPLKTPPLIRKMMQSESSNYRKEVRTTNDRPREPVTYDIHPSQVSPQTQYYTSTTTRAETREREGVSPARQFPTQGAHKPQYGEPPKRLDELLATFGESYTETSRITGDGGGPWKSTPYGPGTQPVRSVRIDDTVQSRSVASDDTMALTKRKPSTGQTAVVPSPVYKAEERALLSAEAGEKGKANMKMDRKYKAGEKSKSSHSERGGQGAAPVPVCLPICCAAPCVIQ